MSKRKKFFLIGGLIVLLIILSLGIWQGVKLFNLAGEYLELKHSQEMMAEIYGRDKAKIPTFYQWLQERKNLLKEQAKLGKALQEYEKKRKEDIYGGETPEQTWQMFIDALKKGDLDLASKFFVLEKQEEWKEKIEKIRLEGKLEDKINEWINAPKNWEKTDDERWQSGTFAQYNYKTWVDKEFIIEVPNGQGGIISQKFPPGEYGNLVTFIRNPYTGKWKIQSF